jgi:uncharacterized protein (DUF433 family)
MSIWQLTEDDIEAIVNQLNAGRSKQEVAEDLGISVEMVVCAIRKWPRLRRTTLMWGF